MRSKFASSRRCLFGSAPPPVSGRFEDKSGVAGQGRRDTRQAQDESALYVAAYVLVVSGSFYFGLCCSSHFGRSSRGRKPTFQSNSVVWRPAHWNILQSWPTIFTTTFSHPGFKQSMEQSRLKALSTVESTCVMKCDVYICEELNADVVMSGGTDNFSPKRHEV